MEFEDEEYQRRNIYDDLNDLLDDDEAKAIGDGISPKKNVSFKSKDRLNIDMNKVKDL